MCCAIAHYFASSFLANKCSIASRIDCFADTLSSDFGSSLRDQVEERLKFFETGDVPRKNIDVMKQVADKLAAQAAATSSQCYAIGAVSC